LEPVVVTPLVAVAAVVVLDIKTIIL